MNLQAVLSVIKSPVGIAVLATTALIGMGMYYAIKRCRAVSQPAEAPDLFNLTADDLSNGHSNWDSQVSQIEEVANQPDSQGPSWLSRMMSRASAGSSEKSRSKRD